MLRGPERSMSIGEAPPEDNFRDLQALYARYLFRDVSVQLFLSEMFCAIG